MNTLRQADREILVNLLTSVQAHRNQSWDKPGQAQMILVLPSSICNLLLSAPRQGLPYRFRYHLKSCPERGFSLLQRSNRQVRYEEARSRLLVLLPDCCTPSGRLVCFSVTQLVPSWNDRTAPACSVAVIPYGEGQASAHRHQQLMVTKCWSSGQLSLSQVQVRSCQLPSQLSSLVFTACDVYKLCTCAQSGEQRRS